MTRARLRIFGWGAAAMLIAALFAAHLLFPAMNWGLEDFAAAAALLAAGGLAMELVAGLATGALARLLLAGVVAGAVLLVWAHLAVGVF